MFFFLAYKIFASEENVNTTKILMTGALCYILLHGVLFSKELENNELVQKFRNYIYYIMLLDGLLTSTYIYLFTTTEEQIEITTSNETKKIERHSDSDMKAKLEQLKAFSKIQQANVQNLQNTNNSRKIEQIDKTPNKINKTNQTNLTNIYNPQNSQNSQNSQNRVKDLDVLVKKYNIKTKENTTKINTNNNNSNSNDGSIKSETRKLNNINPTTTITTMNEDNDNNNNNNNNENDNNDDDNNNNNDNDNDNDNNNNNNDNNYNNHNNQDDDDVDDVDDVDDDDKNENYHLNKKIKDDDTYIPLLCPIRSKTEEEQK